MFRLRGNRHGELVGRDQEVTHLMGLLDAAADGSGSSLSIRGEAGVGKSSLLDLVRQEAKARELLVLSARGSESEWAVDYAGLHQLLRPLLDQHLGRIPSVLQSALRVAVRHEEGATDLHKVCVGALELVVAVSACQPVVILIDDTHWLDAPSLNVVSFMARRVDGESVLMLGATRTIELNHPLRRDGFPEMYVERLDDDSAAALLDSCAPELSALVRQRILQEASGNPLALVELPRSWNLTGGHSIVPVNARLRVAFAARLDQLSAGARGLLAVLAADGTCSIGQYLSAASEVCGQTIGMIEVQQAIGAGLADWTDEELGFRHPLMRSAVYAQLPLATRLAAHAALGRQLGELPDRQLWHQAQAVLGSNAAMAARLEQQATSARERGALTTSITALRQAASLAESPARRTSLFLYAAELACEVGYRSQAMELAGKADLSLLGAVEQGRLALVHEITEPGDFRDERRVHELIAHADAAHEAGAGLLALNLLWRAASRCCWAGLSSGAREAVAAAADALDRGADDPVHLAILALVLPEVHGVKTLAAFERLNAGECGVELRYLSSAAVVLGDFHCASSYGRAAAAASRAAGQSAVLARTLGAVNWCRIWTGEWDLVRSEAQEAADLAQEMGNAFWGLVAKVDLAMLAAQSGDFAVAEKLALEAQASPLLRGVAFVQAAVLHVLGVAALVASRHEEALARLRRLFDPADPGFHFHRWWAAPDLADVARALGRQDEARSLLAGLDEVADQLPSPMLLVCRTYVRAVLADDDTCEELFKEALAQDMTGWPLYRGRLLLAQGTWLRRSRRNLASREPLREARDCFDALGATYWGDRARQELRAAGEGGERPSDPMGEVLSPQELQIVSLAAEGLTNRQIGERLFMSHRTVGTHLYRIFRKLGITTRGQLAPALRAAQGSP